MKEQLDIFDESMNHFGSAPRGEVHKKGLWHQTFHCWIILEHDNERFILFQLRSADKDTFPNLLDISAAGHLLKDESKKDGIREVKEELGIDVLLEDLTEIGIIKEKLIGENFLDYEHCHVFIGLRNELLNDFVIQVDELAGLVEINVADFSNLIKGNVKQIFAKGFKVVNHEKYAVTFQINKAAFVPHHDAYYDKVCRAANEIS
ncbi:NUDIX hydrolase [Aquibacillus rhizosphaerae]|uniref:NUDIX domain-containing protein n=1 Tax=Aquibacillus rhizosphaerae TaxID=3051431 RepID=A0ABT7L3P9_9BACI|nr:NUDIX domain-containing protein [Aquibacillus sp. LR5S19]MDL4840496.1 NUDIX domain-containing protein [Aquibacillus sp. LR5S19]